MKTDGVGRPATAAPLRRSHPSSETARASAATSPRGLSTYPPAPVGATSPRGLSTHPPAPVGDQASSDLASESDYKQTGTQARYQMRVVGCAPQKSEAKARPSASVKGNIIPPHKPDMSSKTTFLIPAHRV